MWQRIIKVWCLPDVGEAELQRLFHAIVNVARLDSSTRILSERDLIVLFPKDAMGYGLGTEILVETRGATVQSAVDIGHVVGKFFPEARHIEVHPEGMGVPACVIDRSPPES